MPLATFSDHSTAPVSVQRLTAAAFAKFGSVVAPDEQIAALGGHRGANYGTAVKLRKVSVTKNNFGAAGSATASVSTHFNVFRCFPPRHAMSSLSQAGFHYTGTVLERHPYSSQTFVPMGRDASSVAYIVVCALEDAGLPQRLPDPATLEAFYCTGTQAVTYAAGTWHAPMIAVPRNLESETGQPLSADASSDFVDFAVLVSENGVPEDDCEECYFDPGFVLRFEKPAGHNEE